MVQLRGMQNRVARLNRRRESPIERLCGSWGAFHDMMIEAVSKGEMDPAEAEDLYFFGKSLHDGTGLL